VALRVFYIPFASKQLGARSLQIPRHGRQLGARGRCAGRVGGVARDGGLSASRRVQRFAFDAAFGGGAPQAAVYAEVAPVVTSVLDGFNVCIFACAPAAPLWFKQP